MLRDESAIPSSLNVGGVENTFVKYWDESATVAVLEFQVEDPVPAQGVAAVEATKEKEKKKKAKCAFTVLHTRRDFLTLCRRGY